jgi:rod shape-determining protein MreD
MRPWRTALVVVALTVVQVALFPRLRVLGVVPDLGLVLAVAVAYRHGAEAGALTGFASGLAYDLFLETPAGLSALSYALTAYAVGVLQTAMLREPRGMTVLVGLLAGLAGGLTFAAIGILAGVEALRGARTLEVVALAALYDAVLAPLVFGLVGRLLAARREGMPGWGLRVP